MANSNSGSQLYVCVTPQPTDLNATSFAALTWVKVSNVGNIGETGTKTNILTYDTLDTKVSQKSKGVSNAGDPEVECARVASDPGQIALRDAAKTNFSYAFKLEKADAPSSSFTNTIFYNRGIVTGPTHPNGRVEDFDLEVFALGLQQVEVIVTPVAI